MDIFSLVSLLGGLAFFLYGMQVMSDGLEKSSNGKLNRNLKKVTQNKIVSILFGAGLAVAVQSSSAVSVMLIGLVNSGILEFGQTICILLGSNVGTTLTSWILSLASINSSVLWINFLKPENFSPLFALVGIIMIMFGKKENRKNIGTTLLGFAVLMYGMEMMSSSMEPLSEMPEFVNLLTTFNNPLLALLIGTVFTGIIQSSAASVAILQALSMSGGITYGMAIPIIMGQNIGTSATALISSVGVKKNAKKVAFVHFAMKIVGTAICLVPFCIGNAVFRWSFTDKNITPVMIAVVHTIFNVVTTAIMVPFTKQIEAATNKIISDKEKEDLPSVILDDRLLKIPTMAVRKSFDSVVDMCMLSKDALFKAMKLLDNFDEKHAAEVSKMESRIDLFEDQLGTYMMKLSKIALSDADSKTVSEVLHTIDDFERIGDYAVNLVKVGRELYEKKDSFSADANREIAKLAEAITEILNITSEAFEKSDLGIASSVEPLEQVIDKLIFEIKRNHNARLRSGNCSKELGFALSDLLTCYERVSDHCSNIAVAVIESRHGTFDTHEYLNTVKNQESGDFKRKFKLYDEKFSLT